ncbi:hypothetical protein BDR04DRAFT_1233078 [Suillus decipiens]|nr:hypothetical protein BDR04DRAFT_1233078 [Suillus decipiens]
MHALTFCLSSVFRLTALMFQLPRTTGLTALITTIMFNNNTEQCNCTSTCNCQVGNCNCVKN